MTKANTKKLSAWVTKALLAARLTEEDIAIMIRQLVDQSRAGDIVAIAELFRLINGSL